MNEEKFHEAVKNMRLMKLSDSSFSADRFVGFSELSEDQKLQIEKEFGKKKKIWLKNSLFYNYYENDYF